MDVVVAVPETSCPIAQVVAKVLAKPFCFGFVKNAYISRTFITTGVENRATLVRRKLTPVPGVFLNRAALLVDDSIVRGTTATAIVDMIRDMEATRLYFASAAPPVLFPNKCGIAVPNTANLIARDRTMYEIANTLGVDGAIYQTLGGLREAVRSVNPTLVNF